MIDLAPEVGGNGYEIFNRCEAPLIFSIGVGEDAYVARRAMNPIEPGCQGESRICIGIHVIGYDFVDITHERALI